MTLIVNGEASEIETPVTITELLAAMDVPKRGVAVAVDGEVVPRSTWEAYALIDGTRVEVLTAVQGG